MFFCSDYNSEIINKDNVCPALVQLETSDIPFHIPMQSLSTTKVHVV